MLNMAISQPVLQMHHSRSCNFPYCDSWRLSVETNNARSWKNIPSQCLSFINNYMAGKQYLSDSNVIASKSLVFAQSLNIAGDGKDVWVFDIDDTLLSTYTFFQARGFASEPLAALTLEASSNIDMFNLPALSESLKFYKKLQKMNFKIVLLTGRSENLRIRTELNLLEVGYTNWERLILRNSTDEVKTAIEYKSEKRQELVDEGYIIHGSSGDQWSDLLGYAVAKRSFKLPNPIYYIA
ncbi:acid phosphatase 1-like [Euphorbia lathyris]|uniref:acid phosphatase 1-like n=1 Tax=Euphorbia lathyris TaxID=212925 RepID=UPI003313D016